MKLFKMMNTDKRANSAKTILFTLIVVASTGAKAQTSGVYLTVADFESEKLTYGIDCRTEKHKIKLHEFLGRDYITVVHEKQSHDLKKKEIFGYRDCDGTIYRLGTDRHYQVINPTEKILIYRIEVPGSKNQSAVITYYFSSSAATEIQDLTLANLKKAFPDNHKFHDSLDTEFGSNGDLASYDSFHKVYKINRLYSNSLDR